MPEELYREFFSGIGGSADPYETSTPLFAEVGLATELGMSMAEWHKLDRWERKMRLYHKILSNKKDDVAMERAKTKAEMDRKFSGGLPELQR